MPAQLEGLLPKPIPDLLTSETRAALADEGLANIRTAIDLGLNIPLIDRRVFGFLRTSCPDLIDIIPEGEDDGSTDTLWRAIPGGPPDDEYANALRKVADAQGVDDPTSSAIKASIQLIHDADRMMQGSTEIPPALVFALLAKADYLAGNDPVPHLVTALDYSSEVQLGNEGEVASNFTRVARIVDECGYDATFVLERAIAEVDILAIGTDEDGVSASSQATMYEDIVGVAVDGGYFDIATEVIDDLERLSDVMGGGYCNDVIAECYAYLGVAQRRAAVQSN